MANLEVMSSAVRKAYGSDRRPNYSFVQKAVEDDPYRSLVDSLREWYTIEDDTDTNDDVSFNFILSRGADTWRLALSMVGPFALLVRVLEPDGTIVLTESTSPDEARIIRTVKARVFAFIDRETLRIRLDVNYLNFSGEPDDEWTVFYAVFTQLDMPPG